MTIYELYYMTERSLGTLKGHWPCPASAWTGPSSLSSPWSLLGMVRHYSPTPTSLSPVGGRNIGHMTRHMTLNIFLSHLPLYVLSSQI